MLELIFRSMQQKTANKKAAMVLVDVHGDLARNVLNSTVNKSQRDRVVFVSSAINRMIKGKHDNYTAVFNFFEIPEEDKTVESVAIYANEIADAIEELLQSSGQQYNSLSVQMSALLKPVIYTIMYSCPNASLAECARFFLDKDGANSDLLALGKQSPIPIFRAFFEHDWFSPEYAITKRSIRTKLLYLLADPMLTMMTVGKSTFNISQILDEGKILIMSLPKSQGKFCSGVLSRLCIAYIHSAMLRRDSIEDIKKRKPCYLFLDEFQNMITNSLAASLAESRKYGLNIIMATQTLKSLPLELRKQALVNAAVQMTGIADFEDRQTYSKQLSVSMTELEKLKPMEFMCRKLNGKDKAFKFCVPILPVRHYLTKSENAELINYIILSGIYVKANMRDNPAPPAPPLPENVQAQQSQQKEQRPKQTPKKKRKDDPFDDDYTTHFNS